MSFDLTFEIAPELYRRAVTTPITGAPSQRRVMIQNLSAALLFPASIFALNKALFDAASLIPMLCAAVLGAGMVLAVWWRQHRKLVRLHGRYNATGGAQRMQISAAGIAAQRPNITSQIEWPFVTSIRLIQGAVLIELPTARLIVPESALPEGHDPVGFAAQLEDWRTA